MADYIQLESGADRITLEDGSGFVLLQSDGIVEAVEHTSGFIGRTLAGTQYRRRPQLGWHDDEGLSVVQDTGGSIQVQRSFEQWSLARASRFNYRGFAQDEDAPAPAEADTLAPFLVRVPFRALGYNRYLQHQDFDSAPVAPEADTLAQFLVRVPFRGLGHNSYLFRTAQDLSFVEPFDLPSFLAKPQYKRLGRNPYLWNTAQDFSFVAPVEESTLAQFLVRLNIRGQYWIVPAYVFNLSPQDEDAPAPPVVEGGTYIPTFRTRRGR
jgi:hypothetical protein